MNPAALTDLGKLTTAHPDWQPHGGMTFCNSNVATVARLFGCVAFFDGDGQPYTANAICGLLEASDDWRAVDYVEASRLANEGQLVVFYHADNPHGHVCFGVPGQPLASGSYHGFVPIVANVGQTNKVMGLNYAFSADKRPKAKVWEPKNPMNS